MLANYLAEITDISLACFVYAKLRVRVNFPIKIDLTISLNHLRGYSIETINEYMRFS